MQLMFGAIRAMQPEMPESKTDNESLENPEFFESELLKAGFRGVEIHPVKQDFPIDPVDGFWSDIVKGSSVMRCNRFSRNRIAISNDGLLAAADAGDN